MALTFGNLSVHGKRVKTKFLGLRALLVLFCYENTSPFSHLTTTKRHNGTVRPIIRVTQRQFLKNICSEDDLRSRIFGIFVVKLLACLALLGFSNPPKMV